MIDHVLDGCRPTALAHYLKALGVLRVISEQADSSARGFWEAEHFVLQSQLDAQALHRFFLEDYVPTPIVAPWNGGSGFFYREGKSNERDPETGKKVKTGLRDQPTAATRVVDAVASSHTARFEPYRRAIREAKQVLRSQGLAQAPKEDAKAELVERLRASLDDEAVGWIDCALLLTNDGAAYPPLLGTGGTEGNLDFTSNFMQRLLDLVDLESGDPQPASAEWLAAALNDALAPGYKSDAIGQFLPGNAGGANAAAGFDGDALVNPWDFVLAIEGTLCFAAAAVRRLGREEAGVLAYPFTVRPAAVGYSSAARGDEAGRGEIWLPVWRRPTGLGEIQAVFGEGRARLRGRTARDGIDFARAVALLGVDRGIEAFERFGFHVRNGLSYFATPLGRFWVRRRPQAGLLDDVDGWLAQFRWRAASGNAPARVRAALRTLEQAIWQLCQDDDQRTVQQALIALGQSERALAHSLAWNTQLRTMLPPVPPLGSEWLRRGDDGSAEFRLAAALASLWGPGPERRMSRQDGSIRRQLEPILFKRTEHGLLPVWNKHPGRELSWRDDAVVSSMTSVMQRRILWAQTAGTTGYTERAECTASLDDVKAFIDGQTSDTKLNELLWGLILLDWSNIDRDVLQNIAPASLGARPLEDSAADEERVGEPPALYALLKLAFASWPIRDVEVPAVPAVLRWSGTGRALQASRRAARRLRASGLPPAVMQLTEGDVRTRRIAAALLFPLARGDVNELAAQILRPKETQTGHERSASQHNEGVA